MVSARSKSLHIIIDNLTIVLEETGHRLEKAAVEGLSC